MTSKSSVARRSATGGRFPERLHLTALVHRYLWEFSEATRRWARWAQDEVARWDDLSITGKERWAVDTYQLPLREGASQSIEDANSST